ncbi:MAG: hypothetical protein ACXW15_10565, partial [Acidimicrobiia bacterium]
MRWADSGRGGPAALAAVVLLVMVGCTSGAVETTTTITTTSTSLATTTAPVAVTEPTESGDGVAGSAGLGDPYDPAAGNGGYDVIHYDLDLDVDVATGALTGIATIEAVALEALSSFNLDLYDLEVSAVALDGGAAAFSVDSGELTVVAAVEPGSTFVVTVGYAGIAGQVASDSVLIPNGWIRSQDGLFTVNEPD